MIIYAPDPLQFYQLPSSNTITLKLSSGGHVIADAYEHDKIRIISISSTDPMDYLNNKIQPGNIIPLKFQID
ncbi:MAG TPA: YlzJ-like family protein [Syntrophomonadaceae bacterium]|nr:YlzJ-like family protein [Syntrophomonadaceae bacterium]